MDQVKIGKFIAECRKNKNLTQLQMAEKLGISDRAISKWENGKCMPDISLLKDICDILDIKLNELLLGERIKDEEYNEISERNTLENINIISFQKKQISQGITLLGCSIAFILSTIVFGRENQMVVIFGGISFGYLLAGMITLFKKLK